MEPGTPPVTRKTLTWRIVLSILHMSYALFWPRKVVGREHIPSKGPVILVANHQSFLDIPLVAIGVLHRHVAFAARRSLADSAILRFIFARVGVILVEPGKGDRVALRRMMEHLKADGALGIFPEGTRSPTGELMEPRKGALLVARSTGAPIVPCAVSGTFRAWPSSSRFPRPGRVRIEFAPPVDSARPDALEACWQTIRDMLAATREPDGATSSNTDDRKVAG